MKRIFAVGITLLLACAVFAAQSSRSTEVQFKAAQHKEEVEGDLKGAIEDYKKIADGKDRALAAQALLRMADAYQKLGDPQSRAVYDRVINQFADQKAAAALARARLAEGSTPAAASISLSKVSV